jgi:ribosomal protein L29
MEKKRMSDTSTDLRGDAVEEISGELRKLLADVFALYAKTKNFHCTSVARISEITTSCSMSMVLKSSR